jgi:hypothetical protein
MEDKKCNSNSNSNGSGDGDCGVNGCR